MFLRPARIVAASMVALVVIWVQGVPATEIVRFAELRKGTHFHGVSVDSRDGSRVYLATHHGIFVVSPGGHATRVSRDSNDYMGFTPHPEDAELLYASGHPAGGGNMGFIASSDGGMTWRQLSKGARGPVDFHHMDVSKADPRVLYGTFRGLQVSRDGGTNWSIVAPLPKDLIDLAASAIDVNRLYAATAGGLLSTLDGGNSWAAAHPSQATTTMVQTGYERDVYAFIIQVGLIRASESSLNWEVLSNDFGDRYVLHLAADPKNAERLYAVTIARRTRMTFCLATTVGEPGLNTQTSAIVRR